MSPKLVSRKIRGASRRTQLRKRTLNLERLEDRCLLSTFTVLNTADLGLGSLRQAILDANATANVGGPDEIRFNIPADDPRHFYYRNDTVAGQLARDNVTATTAPNDAAITDLDPDWAHSWFSIRPATALPAITDAAVIDGLSQADASANTLTLGSNAVLRIEVAPDTLMAGFVVTAPSSLAPGSTIRGLIIGGFNRGVLLQSNGNTVEGSFIGTDPSGTLQHGNNGAGVYIEDASNNLIGGATPPARNLISGNGFNQFVDAGVVVGFNANNNRIQGNYIGTDASGMAALLNFGSGIVLSGANHGNLIGDITAAPGTGPGNVISGNFEHGVDVAGGFLHQVRGNIIGLNAAGSAALGNSRHGVFLETNVSATTIGGTAAGAGNIIAFNSGDGVFVPSGAGNAIRANSIHSNSGLGIDLGTNGVTPNDAGDADTGANNLQNFPVLTSATTTGGTSTTIVGTLHTSVSTSLRVEFFSNAVIDPSGFGEGQNFLGSIVTDATDASGNVSFTETLPTGVPAGHFVTATATHAAGHTSEFSENRIVVAPNTDPVANDDSATVAEDSTNNAIDVLANDSSARISARR